MTDLRNPDRKEVENMLEVLAQKLGHEAIREIYSAYKKIRKISVIKHFSTYELLKASMFNLFTEEYANLELKKISQIEGIPIRTVYKLKNEFCQDKGRS